MLNKARKKFILWAMLAMTSIVIVLVAAVNLVNWNLTDRRLSNVIREIAEYRDGEEADEHSGGENQKEKVHFISDDLSQTDGVDAVQSSTSDEIVQDRYDMETGKSSEKQKPEEEAEPEDGFTEKIGFTEGQGYPMMEKEKKSGHGRSSAIMQYGNRYFTVTCDADGQMLALAFQQDIIAEEEAEALAEQVQAAKAEQGYIDGYKYLVQPVKNNASAIFFLDCSTDLQAQRSLLLVSVIVGAAGILLGFIFILFMSRKTVEPVRISIEKQKQFITNAGHELKTPLSAIATNMDILTMDLGENEWVDGTKKQVGKLRRLVENLVSLSKMEEDDNAVEMQYICISDIADECISGFEAVAEMKGKTLAADMQEGLQVQGDPGMVQQLLSILCDNAIRYSAGEGPIELKLYEDGKNICFTTANPWEQNVDADQLESLFERFYRGDPTRNPENKSSGHGLGLSIARAIAEKNHARLVAEMDGRGWLMFKVSFRKV